MFVTTDSFHAVLKKYSNYNFFPASHRFTSPGSLDRILCNQEAGGILLVSLILPYCILVLKVDYRS